MEVGDILVGLGAFVKEMRALPAQTTIDERERKGQQLLDRVGHLLLEGHLQDLFERYRPPPRVIKCEGCQQRMGCHRQEDIRHLKTHYMPAADFCRPVRINRSTLSPVFRTSGRSPEVSPTASGSRLIL